MCAERVALFSAMAQHPESVIKKIAIVARRKTGKELTPATSCGACRQVMLEFEMRQEKPIEVIHNFVDVERFARKPIDAFKKVIAGKITIFRHSL